MVFEPINVLGKFWGHALSAVWPTGQWSWPPGALSSSESSPPGRTLQSNAPDCSQQLFGSLFRISIQVFPSNLRFGHILGERSCGVGALPCFHHNAHELPRVSTAGGRTVIREVQHSHYMRWLSRFQSSCTIERFPRSLQSLAQRRCRKEIWKI